MMQEIYNKIQDAKANSKKLLSVLVDPDKLDNESLRVTAKHICDSKADLIFVGGSLLVKDNLDNCISILKEYCDIPVTLFPGSVQQISEKADGILFLSLISGRNPDFLIGHQVIAAPILKSSSLEILATGYMLVESGRQTTASYVSNTTPIPRDKKEIAMATAMAGEMMGQKLIYMDGGSGAQNHIPTEMIGAVNKAVEIPIIIGGGIRDAKTAAEVAKAGADVVVVGNAFEDNPSLMNEIAEAIHSI